MAEMIVIDEPNQDTYSRLAGVYLYQETQVWIENNKVHREDGPAVISPDVVRGVHEGTASLGICWDAADLQGLESRPYREDHLAVVVHPGHPLASANTLRFEQALDYEHVGLPSNSAVLVMLRRAAANLGQRLVFRVQVSNFDAALRVVRAGLAISVVPIEVAQTYALHNGLKILPLTDVWSRRQFRLCFRNGNGLSQAARLLLEHLEQIAGRDAPASSDPAGAFQVAWQGQV